MRLTAAILCLLFGAESIAGAPNSLQNTTTQVSPGPTAAASIYITAVTKQGGLVTDLKPEDITITEDKVPAKIEKVNCGKPEPLIVGILVDVSGSRRNDPLLRSHYDALAAFLDLLLTRDDGTYVIAFDNDIYKLSEVTADRAAISAAFDKLRKHQPHGSTALFDAIKGAAGAKFHGRSGHRILVVVGDWDDNTSGIPWEKAAEVSQRSLTTVYAVVDGTDGNETGQKNHRWAMKTAAQVTQETGGLAYDVYGKEDFAKALKAIRGAVTGSCRVEYTTSRIADAKKGIKLHVEANSKDISILYPSFRYRSPR